MPTKKTNPHEAFGPAEPLGTNFNLDNGPHGWFSNHWVMYDLGSECSSVGATSATAATESRSKRSAPE